MSSVMLFINVISSILIVYFFPAFIVKFFRDEYFDKITVLFTSFPGCKNKIKFCNKWGEKIWGLTNIGKTICFLLFSYEN